VELLTGGGADSRAPRIRYRAASDDVGIVAKMDCRLLGDVVRELGDIWIGEGKVLAIAMFGAAAVSSTRRV